MVRKIETEEQRQLDPSTMCDLLTIKISNDQTCYLINDTMLQKAKKATMESEYAITFFLLKMHR